MPTRKAVDDDGRRYGPKAVKLGVWRSKGKLTLCKRTIGVENVPLIPCDADPGYAADAEDSEDYEITKIVDAYQCATSGVTLHYLCVLKDWQGLWWIAFENMEALELVQEFVGLEGCYSCRHKKQNKGCGSCDAHLKCAQCKQARAAADADVGRVQAKLRDAERKLRVYERLAELKHPGEGVEQGLADALNEVHDLAQKLSDAEKRLQEKDEEIEQLKKRIVELEAEVEVLRGERDDLRQKLTDNDEMHEFMVTNASAMDDLIKRGLHVKKVPKQKLLSVTPTPTNVEIDANGKFPDRSWPTGADWEITYGIDRLQSLETPDTNIGPFPNVASARNLFCLLLERTCIRAEIWVSFVDFTPGLVEMFTAAEKTGNIMQGCKTIAAGGANEDLFRDSIASTDGFDEDYHIHLSDDE